MVRSLSLFSCLLFSTTTPPREQGNRYLTNVFSPFQPNKQADSSLLFDDLFTLTSLDKDGKKFDRVSRLQAISSNHGMNLTLDFNLELYPLKLGDCFALALSSSLTPEGEKDGGAEIQTWRLEEGKGGLADEYEYVMYGKVNPKPL